MPGDTLVETLIDLLLYTDGNSIEILHNNVIINTHNVTKNSVLCSIDNHKFPYNMLRQYMFLRDIQERLNSDVGQKEVIAKIESVQKVLISPRNMFAYMAVNVDKLTKQVPDVYDPWNKYFSDFMSAVKTK